jgi:hypothetical protein
MSCGNCNCGNPYAKSCVRVYNDITQPFTAAGTQITLEGTPVVNSGVSIELNPGSIEIEKSGLYRLSADVTINPTAAGTVVVQLYRNGVALPCAIAQNVVSSGNLCTLHVETDQQVQTCCVNHPVYTLRVSGVAGNVTHICVGALKLA